MLSWHSGVFASLVLASDELACFAYWILDWAATLVDVLHCGFHFQFFGSQFLGAGFFLAGDFVEDYASLHEFLSPRSGWGKIVIQS